MSKHRHRGSSQTAPNVPLKKTGVRVKIRKIARIEVTPVQVRLSSGEYTIIASGETFLFEEFGDLTIQLENAQGPLITLVLKFLDETGEHSIQTEVQEDALVVSCRGFKPAGTGMTGPVHFATIEEKKLYLMFWSQCHGGKEGRTRSVKYTIFSEP